MIYTKVSCKAGHVVLFCFGVFCFCILFFCYWWWWWWWWWDYLKFVVFILSFGKRRCDAVVLVSDLISCLSGCRGNPLNTSCYLSKQAAVLRKTHLCKVMLASAEIWKQTADVRSSHVAPQFKITWQKQKQHIYVTRYVLATLKKAEICWCLLNVRQHWIKYWWHIMYKSDTKTGEIEFFNGIYI